MQMLSVKKFVATDLPDKDAKMTVSHSAALQRSEKWKCRAKRVHITQIIKLQPAEAACF